jgi:DNA-binding IclR family transcriptional regulator
MADQSPKSGVDTAPAGRRIRGRRPEHGDPVVDRALSVLAAFDEEHRRLTLSDLARRTGLPLSTARRLAVQLAEWGALERDETGRYSIGLRLWEVASLAERGLSLRDVASPFLDDLNVATRQHIQLAVLDGQDAVVLDRRTGATLLPVRYRIGGRLPLIATAVGIVLLAHAGADLQEQVIGSAYRWPLHECPRPAPHEVRAQLAQARRAGGTVVRRPTSPVASVAVAVRDRNAYVVAAVAAVLPLGSVEPAQLVPALRATARGISRRLGAQLSRSLLPDWSR